ncbi:hypothetical protein TI39_contig623g00009 [Zymoseptoria brevis]|uniref:Heme oxygenase-like protein n=1 Tax=Zymoseptoria brevis TaxID=1047168 RepID=A0A0F4GGB4_9PEZI|nr:hypothetical protein TI39_contig623g00009 [Zymoseptoria brevis]
MPRPPDHYTHAQFEPVESDHAGETVQCRHCRNWTGSIKTLNRKKAHLLTCTQYAQWRAAGNGQDLAPPNKYHKRDSSVMGGSWEGQGDGNTSGFNMSPFNDTPTVARGRNLDLTKYFSEFWDDTASNKCMRVRCLSCGFVRAKNTTRQVEHLASCSSFLNSTEGQAAVANGELEMTPAAPRQSFGGGNDIWRGGAPNPNLQVSQTPTSASRGGGRAYPMPPPPKAPSLVSHLLNKFQEKFNVATQQSFLSHAGCGTLSHAALCSWLTQHGHISRAMIAAIGSLIAKVFLPDAANTRIATPYRALDLLISTISNLRKEIDFIENTKRKYRLDAASEPPSPMTKAYVDLLASASEPRADLLEGMVALWATEHLYCVSWQYAANFQSTVPSNSYSVPSYLSGGSNPLDPYAAPTPAASRSDQQHATALREALIPNWTSREFCKFVDACRAIVDEIANKESVGDGRHQLSQCELLYKQVVFLWERIWPEVDGMGEEKTEDDVAGKVAGAEGNGESGQGKNGGNSIEIQADGDDDADGDGDGEGAIDSPYGGTGLEAVAAANRSG